VSERRGRLAKFGLVFSALLILYNTLIPFRLYIKPSKIIRNFGLIEWTPFFHNGSLIPLTDIVGNIVLFLPIGFFAAAVFYFNSRSKQVLKKTILFGLAFSFFIEFSQVFFKYRVSSVHDLITNSIGAAIGGWVAIHFIKNYFDELLKKFNSLLLHKPYVFILLLFLIFKFIDFIFPETIIFQVQNSAQAWQLTELIPFVNVSFFQFGREFLFYTVFGLLLSDVKKMGNRSVFVQVFVILSLILIFVQAVHILFYAIPGNINYFLAALAGFYVGLNRGGFGKQLFFLKNNLTAVYFFIACYILFDGLVPFNFSSASFSDVTIKSFVPFYHYFKETSFLNIKDLMYSFVFSFPLGWAICSYFPKTFKAGMRIFFSALIIFLFSFAIEVAQVFLPTRVPDITDVLVMVSGAITGAWLFLYYLYLQKLEQKTADDIKNGANPTNDKCIR
jgi:VanZ family protein